MCYFLYLKIIERGRADYADKFISSLSESGMSIDGKYPEFLLTDGMCSCNFVSEEGRRISLTDDFLKNLLSDRSIKNILIGWNWGDIPPNMQNKLSLDVTEFIEKNRKAELQADMWYRLYDSNKYNSS